MKFTETNQWALAADKKIKIGITKHICQELGEIVHISLPKVGDEVKEDEVVAVLESTKSAIDLHSPLSGKVVEINEALVGDISLINESPESNGWLFILEVENLEGYEKLMDEKSYLDKIKKGLL